MNEDDDLFRGLGIEVRIAEKEDFSKIVETLTRIGILSKKESKLYQSCHILHKTNRDTGKSHYAIIHFKEMFKLDGKFSDFSDEDKARRNRIAFLLQEWGLLKIVDPDRYSNNLASMNQIKIIPFKDKGDYVLEAKYTIGKKK